MKQHLIVLDLDGTLLTDEKVISDKTEQTLRAARQAGHQVMIATGRPYRASEPYYRQLNLDVPIVNFNGAFVHHPADRSWKPFHEPISLPVVGEVVEALQDFNVHNVVAEVMDDVYIHRHDEKLMNIFTMGEPSVTVGDLRSYLKDNPTSLLIHPEQEDQDKIRQHLADVHAEVIDHRRWGAPWHVIEVIRHGLNKAVGISKVAGWLDIPQERIIAFGDEDNDYEMIEYAGTGVAMGNAINGLKSIADEVTGTNNEDGIAAVLEERLKLKLESNT
ncbi:hypothetical protein SAMN04488127_2291 [Bhargavaea ginsengi]|uniref:Cof subfamily of IIB subfamily of haloacid dehalogenase superfamily/HAD-superfamily hydrolase, subfamily IIB n=1 Tax=Bhargavaea ginsengi TaxID=426757 RepID=A0A1H7A790_9BACL|nr:Cof-type HAD-IIB family hydrolase [Bhargavaea ginsengi]MCM3088146.1 Cof-type HAD-IIB family hydrolase [Bhargavaea ginsengi]SEJ61471.1 hypothetical protein SAMN04488127_2291 [Bhargavaea ginsengi]